MNLQTLKPKEFLLLQRALGKDMRNKCDYCKKSITSKSFGFVSKDIVSCKSLVCLGQAIAKVKQKEELSGEKE